MPTIILDHTATVAERVEQYLAVLNQKEFDRRVAVNGEHLATHGRMLYPEGGQYAVFTLDKPGRKFTRVVMTAGGHKSVHAFVDREGGVYMPAGWKAPAKNVRFDLMDAASRADCLSRCAFASGYLYKR